MTNAERNGTEKSNLSPANQRRMSDPKSAHSPQIPLANIDTCMPQRHIKFASN